MKLRLWVGGALAGWLGLALAVTPVLRDINLDIVADGGRVLSTYPRADGGGGAYRAYLEAERGARYSIRIRNNLVTRVGLVIAVDGRNIVSGQHSELSSGERMYVLDPGGQASYSGWRTGRDQVNRFYFTDAADSYAYAWNDTADIGVIAVAVYREQRDRYRGGDQKYREGAPAPGMSSQPGTGFGEDRYSPSRQVEFTPEPYASSRYFIEYEWRDTLCRQGIAGGCGPRYRPYEEEPFRPDDGFAAPPPRYAPQSEEPLRRWRR